MQPQEREHIFNGPDAMQNLYRIYVEVNRQSESNPQIKDEARRLFSLLESKDECLHAQWSKIRETTVKSLEEVYARLNIRFDHYHGEAMYGDQKVGHVLKQFQNH